MPTLQPFKAQLAQDRHRGLVVIAGDRHWGIQQLVIHADLRPERHSLWLADTLCLESSALDVILINPKQALLWLGQQCDQLIIDGHQALNLSALGALTGTIRAGGICYLLCPSLADWPQQERLNSSRLIRHWVNVIQADQYLVLLEQKQPDWQRPTLISTQPSEPFSHSCYKSAQQQLAVEKIKRVALGHRHRPLVLTADRGRGKSSALGLALSELLQQGKQKIIISAPQVSCVEAVFARAAEQLTVLKRSATTLICEQGSVFFIPPDELIRQPQSADLVMIDEAAAIPAPMLTALLKQYSRIVFTSTIAGYEGTGRSFEIRFKQTLGQLTPNWQAYTMDQPIRWAVNDPLENFVNQALLLNAQLALVNEHSQPISEFTFTCWDRDQLLAVPQQLAQIMGLLLLSHYKTTPDDLRHLLDGADIHLFTQSHGQNIIGVVLVAIEGHLPESLCRQIWCGERRPKGHLLPQTLSFHAGFSAAPQYRYARIVRIAIHPECHRQGLGSRLLEQLKAQLSLEHCDFMGSSFGATAALLHFWQKNNYTIVRLGILQEATSNEYSAVVLQPLTLAATKFSDQIRDKFDQELPSQLFEFYPLLSAKLVIQLLQQRAATDLASLSLQQQSDLECYVDHQREYEFSCVALHQYALLAISKRQTNVLNEPQQQLLVDKVLRKKCWATVADELGYTGKKSAAAGLKAVFRLLIDVDV